MKFPGKEITISSWSELIEKLHSKNLVQFRPEEGNHFRSPYVFRGMDVSSWHLETSLQRIPRNINTNLGKVESSLIRSFRKYANAGAFDQKSEWYVLAVAQHNGLPTRCIDWTFSPLVAAHFACGNEKYKNDHGIIWCMHAGILRDINEKNNLQISNLSGHDAWVYDTRLLEGSYQDLAALDVSSSNGELLLLWEPPSLDARIASQAGLLSITNSAEGSQDTLLQTFCKQNQDLIFRIVIDAAAKSEIRDMLDQNNISERSLFPGLPGLCDWLKRYYSKAW